MVTAGVLCASVAAKVMETPDATASNISTDLAQQALYWKDIACNDENLVIRLQHYITSATLLQVARSLSSDQELERVSGVDVAKVSRSVDNRIAKTRQILEGQTQQTR